jgi:TusA-related sulfurtransferase
MNLGAPKSGPEWLADADHGGQKLDVRPLLESGEDPLLHVIQASMTIPPDGFLVLDAPFNPTPLRGVLAGQGFSSFGRKIGDGHWRIAFRRDGLSTTEDEASGEECAGPGGGELTWEENGVLHADVRGLPPPVPMLTILRLVKRVKIGDHLIVHHEREPMYLIPELAELGWQVEQIPGEEGEVRLRISRVVG